MFLFHDKKIHQKIVDELLYKIVNIPFSFY